MADDDLEKRLSDLTQGIGDCEEPEKEPPKQVGYEEFLPKSDDSTFKMPDLSKPLFPIDDTVTSRSLSGITFPISSSPKKSTSTFDHEAFRKQMERMNTKEEEIIKKGDIRIILESYNGYPTERYRLFAEVGGERTQLYEHQYFQRLNLMKTEKFKEKPIYASLSPDRKRLAFEVISDQDASMRNLAGLFSLERVNDLYVVNLDGTRLVPISLNLPREYEEKTDCLCKDTKGTSIYSIKWTDKNTFSVEAKMRETVPNPHYDSPLFKNMYGMNQRYTTRDGDKYRATIKLAKDNLATVKLEKVEEK